MIKFQSPKKKWEAFQCFTGQNLAAFYELLASFERADEADLDKRDKARERKRQRERGGRRSGALPSVEHCIGGIQVFRIVHDIFRNFREDFDDLVMETACGLHNWRLNFRLTT